MPMIRPRNRTVTSGRWARWHKIVVALGAVAVAVGAIWKTGEMIYDSLFPTTEKPEVRIGWMTVPDPKSLSCIIGNTGTFKLSDTVPVSLAQNECLSEIKTRTSEPAAQNPSDLQTLGKSYFLLLENQGVKVEKIELTSNIHTPVLASFREVAKGSAYAVCMGYEGRGGTPSRHDLPQTAVVTLNGKSFNIQIPTLGENTSISVPTATCKGFVWGYPPK